MESQGPKLIGEETVKCPVCGEKSLKLSIYLYEVPYLGSVVIETGKCVSFRFKWSDVGLLDYGRPKRIVLKVRGPKELNALVIKSAPATVRIPELGIEITPGPAAPGYITTVEGVLHRVLDHVPSECFEPSSICYQRVQAIRDAADGKVTFTIVIEDPSGRSAITGENIRVVEESLPEVGETEKVREKP